MRIVLAFAAGMLLSQFSHADRITFTVYPPATYVDGTPLGREDLTKCRVLDVTDPTKERSLSSVLLNKSYTFRVDEPGIHRYTADCTDINGKAGVRGNIVSYCVVGNR